MTKAPCDMSQTRYSSPAGLTASGMGSDPDPIGTTPTPTPAPAAIKRNGTKSRKRHRTPPHPLITTASGSTAQSQGHQLAVMPSAFLSSGTQPNQHPFSLQDPSLLSPTAAYPPVTDPLSSSLPAMLSDSLRLTSPEATAGGGGSLHSTPPSASPGTCQDEERAGLFMIHTYNSFDQQQQQHCSQPAASSTHARPRFVARRHSDVMPISYQLSKSWTPNDGDSALLEAPAHAAGDGSNVAPTSPTDSHFSQATTMQYSPTTSTFDSLAYQAPTSQAQAERPHPHVSPSSYSPHPHVLPTIPAIGIGGTAFHPHSIAPPPPPPTFPSTAADQSSPNPTAKKKMRSEPPPALLPVSSSAAVATPPSSAGLGLFNTSSLTAVDADAGVRGGTSAHLFDQMMAMSQPIGTFDATSPAGDLQYSAQHHYLYANDEQPMEHGAPDLFPHHAQSTLNGGGAHPFMFHTSAAAASPASLVPDTHSFLDPIASASASGAAHPSPFRPGGLLDPTNNAAQGSTFLFDVSLMNPSPMASPYMVRSSRPGSASASASSDSRPTSAHSGLVIHAATTPSSLAHVHGAGSGAAETARRAVAGSAYQRGQPGGGLDAYELARALGGPIHMPTGTGMGQASGHMSSHMVESGHASGESNGMHMMLVDSQQHHQHASLPFSGAPHSTVMTYGSGSGASLAAAFSNSSNNNNIGGSLSPMSVSSSAAGATSLGGMTGVASSTSPTEVASLFFTDTVSPVGIGETVGVASATASAHHFPPEFATMVGVEHLDPLISAAHADDVNGFEQLVQALLMNHPDLLPTANEGSVGSGLVDVGVGSGATHASFSMVTPTIPVHGSALANALGSVSAAESANATHVSTKMDVDIGPGHVSGKHEGRDTSGNELMDPHVNLDSGMSRLRMEKAWSSEDMMDVIMEDCEHPQQAHECNDDADNASVLSGLLHAGGGAGGVQNRRRSHSQQPLEQEALPPPTPTRQRQFGPSTGQQQQGQHDLDSPRQRAQSHADAHTAAAALMLVELHNRAAPEHRRMSTIDVPPPSPPSIVRVQVADGNPLASSPSGLPLSLPGSALYAHHHHQQQQHLQQTHQQRQHPANIQMPDTHTPTTRTLTDQQLQTIVESMLYATSLQGSCHSQGCWHMYARAYLSTHGELPRDASREPERWVGRWGLCKVSLYTPRVAQKSYGSEKRFLCPPPMISVVGAPLFPESPLGQPMGLPPAPAKEQVPRWITVLPEAYQPQVIMLMRGEIEGVDLPEDASMEPGGGGGGTAAGGVGDANDTIVSTQRGERVMLSEAGWRAAASSLPAAVLAKMISAMDRAKERQVTAAKRQRQQAKGRMAAVAAAAAADNVKTESSDVEMVDEQADEDTGNSQEPPSHDEEDEEEFVTANSTTRPSRARTLRTSVRSSVRTRSQVRSTSARGAAGSTPSPRKAAAAVAPMVRARRASVAAFARDPSSSSSSAGESDSDASGVDGAGEDSDAATGYAPSGKSTLRTARTPAGNSKGMVAVEKYCTEALCAEVPAERWVFRNVWISDSERRKEFSCVFQLAEPAISSSVPTSSSMAGADKGKKKATGDQKTPKKLLEFASKPVRVISKPSKKKIEVRSTGASPSAGIIYAGSLIALFNRIRSQTVSTKYLSIGSSVPVPVDTLTREVLSCAEVNKPQKSQGDVDLDQDRFLANLDVVKHVFPGAIKSEQLKYLCSTASWAALRLEVVDEFERHSPYLNLPQFNCQCEVCATAAEYRDALLRTSPDASGASTPEMRGQVGGVASSSSSSSSSGGSGVGSSRLSSSGQMPTPTQCLTRGKIVSFNQTVVLVDPVTGLRSREFIMRRVDNNTTVILAEGHLLTTAQGTASNSASVTSQPQVTSSGRATASSALPSTRNSGRQHLGSGQFPPLRPLHTHPWVLHTYRQASPCASHDPHAASAASHALSIIQVSGSRTGAPDAQTLARAFEAPKLDPIAQLHKVAFQLKDSAEYTGAFLTVVGNDIGLYIPQSNHMSFVQSDEPKRPAAGARARRNSCPAQPSQLSEAGSTKDVRAGTLTVDVTEGSVWTIVNADKAERSFYIPHPHLLEVDGPLGTDMNHQGLGSSTVGDDNAKVDSAKIMSTSAPARKCISSLSALSPFPTIKSHTIATAARSYMTDGTPNPASVHGMSTTLVLDGNHFLDHPFSVYLADMKCSVDWESNTHATVTFPSPVTILRHLFVGPASARPGSVPRDASLSPKYSAFIVTPDALHAGVIEERVDTMSAGADAQLMSASQHPGGVVKAPIPVRLLSERIIGLSLGSNPFVPPLRAASAPTVTPIAPAPMPAASSSTESLKAQGAPAVPEPPSTHPTQVALLSTHVPMNPGLPTSTVDSSHRPQLHPNLANDTQPYQPSPLRSVETTAQTPSTQHVVSPASVLAIPPPAGTTYPLALTTTVAAPSSIFGATQQPFPLHIHHMIQRGMLNGIPSAFTSMPPVSFNPLDARFASAPSAAIVDAFNSSRYLRASMPISPDVKPSTQPRPTLLTSPLSYAPINHSAVASPPPAAPPSTKSPMPPATPARAHPVSGKTSASQRTPTQPKVGKSSPDSSSLSSASSTPPFTKPLARSATLPPSGLKSSASSMAPSSSASGSVGGARRGQGGQSASKKQPPAAPEPPSIVPLPIGVVTVDMVRSPSLLLPLYFVRADGVVYETGRSFLFRLDETVLGSGNVVVLE